MNVRPKILIVDDKPENLYALEMLLCDTDADIIKATHGNDALIASLNHEFALAILDVQMPGMDGYELAAYLRGQEKTRALPIIFMSAAYTDDDHVIQGYDIGVVDYITKPYHPRILLSKVKIFLQLDRQRVELSEKMESEKALWEALSLQTEIAANMAEGVQVTRTSDGVIVYTNPRFEEMFGYGQGELIGKSVSVLNAPGDKSPEETAEEIIKSLNERGVWYGAVHNIKKDGTPFWCQASVSTLEHPPHGKVWVAVHQDITERKRAEQRIQQLNAELEQRVVELKAVNQELEAFSYSVSHDLRAPLRAIDGFAHVLLEDYSDILDTDGQRVLNIIRSSTQDMRQLIDDLLAFSRLGRKGMSMSGLDMDQLVQDVFEQLQRSTGEQRVRLNLQALPSARGDRAMIREVWANLLSNALKFTRPREVALIEVAGRVEGNETLYYVKDNGVGFDMEYAHKLFRVFQRLHGIEEFEGTGIGLALVQRIIHRHDGRVWAEAKVDEGATFYFTLPRTKETEDGS